MAKRADSRQRAGKVEDHQAGEHIRVGGTLAKPQSLSAGAHDEHGTDEQHPGAAVDGPALLHRQSYGAGNNGEPACDNWTGRSMRLDYTSDFDGVFRLRWSRCRLHSPRAERMRENIPVTPIT
jgi:hypothetical protein